MGAASLGAKTDAKCFGFWQESLVAAPPKLIGGHEGFATGADFLVNIGMATKISSILIVPAVV